MATNPYVNKVVYGNDTVMDISDTDATADDVLNGKKFYLGSGAPAVGTAIGGIPEEELRDTVGWTGKNLLNYPVGIRATIANDGTINETSLHYCSDYIDVQTLKCVISCDSKSGNPSVRIGQYTANKTWISRQVNNVFPWTITFDSNTKYVRVSFEDNSTDKLTNPMLRYASISDPTYEPYHESVKQVLRDGEVIEGKNLLNPDILSVNVTGLTYAPIYVGNGDFTLSTTAPLNSQNTANLYLLAGNISSGASTPTNGVYINNPITQTAINGYVTVASRSHSGVDIKQYNNQLEKGTIPTTYEPYYIPLKDSKFDRSEQRVLGAKNLLPNNATTQTVNGVTFTVNSDGSVTANGTASAQTAFSLYHENQNCPYIGGAILSGCPNGGSVSTYDLRITDDTTSTNADYGEGVEVGITNTGRWTVAIMIRNGQVCNNLVFKPMLRLASDPDDTYVPYAMTNKELTDQVVNKVITLTKAQYDALSTAEKNDPSKVYYVTDYDAPKTYVELDDSSISLDKVWSGQKIKNYADNAYTLPNASSSTKGGIYVGNGLTASSGVLSVRGLNGIYVDSDGVYLRGSFGSDTAIFTMRESRSVSNAVQRVNVSFNCTETYTEDYFKKHRISYLFLLPSSGSGAATAIVLSQSVGSSVVNLQTIAFREPDSPTSFTATRAQLWM